MRFAITHKVSGLDTYRSFERSVDWQISSARQLGKSDLQKTINNNS